MDYFRKVILLTLAFFLSKAFGGSEHKKSVHFKIHVPEIIKHHIHTKTVFIHVHETKPKKHHKEENHVEDWTSYNAYNYNDGLGGHQNGEDLYRNNQANLVSPYDDYMPIREDDYQPAYQLAGPYDNPENQLVDEPPPPNDNPLGFFGAPIDPEEIVDQRAPPQAAPPEQYAIHEEVNEEPPPNELDGYRLYHEDGYRRGMHSETGKVVHKDVKDFYDKEHDEAAFNNANYENNQYHKYQNHAGHASNNNHNQQQQQHHGNYDKEIGHEQRVGKKKRADRRFFVARMVIR